MGSLTKGRTRGDETLLAHLIREVDGRCPSCDRRLDFDNAFVLTRPAHDRERPWSCRNVAPTAARTALYFLQAAARSTP
jgi:hypothetical protein